MRKIYVTIIFMFLCAWSVPALFGQVNRYGKLLYTTNRPQYKQWKTNYSLSKIRYYEKRIVIDIQLVFRQTAGQWTKSVAFMSPQNLNAWCLKDAESGQVFELLEIRNVRRNNKEIKKSIRLPKDKVHITLDGTSRVTEIFTCEVHFNRLPNAVVKVDLLEGASSKYEEGHWNFFDIHVRQFQPVVKENVRFIPEPIDQKGTNSELQHRSLISSKDIQCNEILELSNIRFQDNSTKFQNSMEAERVLFMLSTYLKQSPGSTLELYGHTDVFGNAERNQSLSQQRVEKLQQWFQKQKILNHRIQTVALGATQPIYPEGNPKNRRVEVKIICPESD